MIGESSNQDCNVANAPQALDVVSNEENFDDEHYTVRAPEF